MTRSLIEVAYELLSEEKQQLPFSKIWEYVVKESGLTPDEAAKRAGQFLTNMMLDGRFVTLGGNEWDLRARHTFDKVHIDMKDVYSDVDTNDDDAEEKSEENTYNQAFDESKDEDENASGEEEGQDSSETESDEF